MGIAVRMYRLRAGRDFSRVAAMLRIAGTRAPDQNWITRGADATRDSALCTFTQCAAGWLRDFSITMPDRLGIQRKVLSF